jgi:hypothetical protein
MDELNYSAPSSSSKIEHKSVEVAMHATETELQNAEMSGAASLHSIQHHVQSLTTSAFFLGGRRGMRNPKHFVNLTGESKNFS